MRRHKNNYDRFFGEDSYFKPNDLSRSRKSKRHSRFEEDEHGLTYTIDDIEKNRGRNR